MQIFLYSQNTLSWPTFNDCEVLFYCISLFPCWTLSSKLGRNSSMNRDSNPLQFIYMVGIFFSWWSIVWHMVALEYIKNLSSINNLLQRAEWFLIKREIKLTSLKLWSSELWVSDPTNPKIYKLTMNLFRTSGSSWKWKFTT